MNFLIGAPNQLSVLDSSLPRVSMGNMENFGCPFSNAYRIVTEWDSKTLIAGKNLKLNIFPISHGNHIPHSLSLISAVYLKSRPEKFGVLIQSLKIQSPKFIAPLRRMDPSQSTSLAREARSLH